MAALDVDTTIQNVKTVLSNIAGWQTICGVSTAAEAAERIFEYGVDEFDDTLTPCIILDVEESSLTRTGGKMQGNVFFTVRMELEIPPAQRETYSTQGRWFWQKLQTILAGFDSNQGTTGGLQLASFTMPVKPGRIDPDTNQGRCEWMVMLGLEIYLL